MMNVLIYVHPQWADQNTFEDDREKSFQKRHRSRDHQGGTSDDHGTNTITLDISAGEHLLNAEADFTIALTGSLFESSAVGHDDATSALFD